MRITEVWENRDEVIKRCRENNACKREFTHLLKAKSKQAFENVLLRNFSWCVDHEILEEWLPAILPVCKKLSCPNRTELACLPTLPKCVNLWYRIKKIA